LVQNLSLPSLEKLNGADITHVKQRHPKEDQDFNVPQETIIIKGNFLNMKTDKSKSAAYHKMVQSKCGDDNVQCRNGQNIIQVDPCL
jgi:hypothetical protein